MKKRERSKEKIISPLIVAIFLILLIAFSPIILSQDSFNPDDISTWARALSNPSEKDDAIFAIIAELKNQQSVVKINNQFQNLNNQQRQEIWDAFNDNQFDSELRALIVNLDKENKKLLTDAFDTNSETKKQNIIKISRLTSANFPNDISPEERQKANDLDEKARDEFAKIFIEKNDDLGISTFFGDELQRKNNIETTLSIKTENIASIEYNIAEDGSKELVITDKNNEKRTIPLTGINSESTYFTDIEYRDGSVFYIKDENHRFIASTKDYLQYRNNQWVLVGKVNGKEYNLAIDLKSSKEGIAQITKDENGIPLLHKWGDVDIQTTDSTVFVPSKTSRYQEDYGYIKIKDTNSFEISGFEQVSSDSNDIAISSPDKQGFSFVYKGKDGKDRTIEGLELVTKTKENINALRTDGATLTDEDGRTTVSEGSGLISDEAKKVIESIPEEKPQPVQVAWQFTPDEVQENPLRDLQKIAQSNTIMGDTKDISKAKKVIYFFTGKTINKDGSSSLWCPNCPSAEHALIAKYKNDPETMIIEIPVPYGVESNTARVSRDASNMYSHYGLEGVPYMMQLTPDGQVSPFTLN